jgi:hypothetical protein
MVIRAYLEFIHGKLFGKLLPLISVCTHRIREAYERERSTMACHRSLGHQGAQMAAFLKIELVVPPMTIEVTGDDGKTKSKAPNPEFGVWYARDQHVFSYLLTTLPHEMAVQAATCHIAAELWNTVQGMLSSHTRA